MGGSKLKTGNNLVEKTKDVIQKLQAADPKTGENQMEEVRMIADLAGSRMYKSWYMYSRKSEGMRNRCAGQSQVIGNRGNI